MTVTTHRLNGFAALLPEYVASSEDALAQGAGRDAERAEGRRHAAAAMRVLGVPSQPVDRGPAGQPLWPAGLVGSITHGAGTCAAVVGRRCAALGGLGIDAAPNRPLTPRVARRVLPGSCWPAPGRSADWTADRVHWDAVVLSTKEAVFKAWFPITGRSLRFSQARLDVRADGTIRVDLDTDGAREPASRPLPRLRGRFAVTGDIVRTAVVAEVR